ncbi:hypothetical protein [Synechococcus elongatus]|uniref:hypothetical protein n=1 Tax=Synechococcus elongatus TaxID=32046 RepID=UPI000F7F54B1|nr:hypothetical protein [Synechococcus elongatus]
MTFIQAIGTVYYQDAAGYLVNESSLEKIDHPWRSLVQSLLEGCQSCVGASLHSLYLRGSIPQGKAIQGISDLDSILVWQHQSPDPAAIDHLQQQLQRQAPFCQGIEIAVIGYDALQVNQSLQTLLKIQGLCLWGQDLITTWPAVQVGPQLLIHQPHLERDLAAVQHELRQLLPSSPRFHVRMRESCRWITKRLLRTGYELVMEREQAYTRDLYPCYVGFARHYPEQAGAMYKALELAIAPSRHRAGLLLFLQQLGPYLLQQANSLH